jgi:hypothetical protein
MNLMISMAVAVMSIGDLIGLPADATRQKVGRCRSALAHYHSRSTLEKIASTPGRSMVRRI